MNTIKRDVYVLKNTIKIPIEVTKGTDAITFEFTVRDYNLPVTAAAVAYAYHKSMKKPNSTLCDVANNVISFQPSANFFEVGMNELQIRVINEDKSLISFKEKVKCSDSMGFPDEEEEADPSLIEQIIAQSGKESGERKAADEKERSERKTADETEKSERIAADAKEKSERQKEIATERARIDQLTKMGEGSTTGDAELEDIRVGNEGATYSNAGNAVRSQTKDVPVMMDNLQSPYVDISLLEQGSINNAVGSEIASSKVLRSVEFQWNKNGKITAPAGYKIAIANYAMQPDESGQMFKVYMSFENYSDSQTSSKADGDAESRRLLIKRADGADINAEDLRGKITTNVPGLRAMDVIENLEKKIKTDTTLEKEGVAADAAETGKRILQVKGDIGSLKEDIHNLDNVNISAPNYMEYNPLNLNYNEIKRPDLDIDTTFEYLQEYFTQYEPLTKKGKIKLTIYEKSGLTNKAVLLRKTTNGYLVEKFYKWETIDGLHEIELPFVSRGDASQYVAVQGCYFRRNVENIFVEFTAEPIDGVVNDYDTMQLYKVQGAKALLYFHLSFLEGEIYPSKIESALKGKRWAILGDSRSIAQNEYSTKHYFDYINEWVGGMILENRAVSGARFLNGIVNQPSLIKDPPDIITVYGGVNDYAQDDPTTLGAITDSFESDTFYGKVKKTIYECINNFPTAITIFITPVGQNNFTGSGVNWTDRNETNSLGLGIKDYVKAIKECCAYYNVPIYDDANEGCYNPNISSQRNIYFKDGLHQNEKGNERIAIGLKAYMESKTK